MDSLDLEFLGGLPLTQADLKLLQDTYLGAFASVANVIGDKVVVNGMVEAGGNVSAGWICIAGELLPFVGGAIGTGKFTLQQTTIPRTFHDGSTKGSRITRAAVFSSTGEYNYSDLRRIGTLTQIWCIGDQKPIHCDGAYVAANFDSTGKGIAGTEREGWAICNGNNGAEDLRGYFLVGYDDRNVDPVNNIWDIIYNTVGATGGEKKHTLTTSEMPAHGHSIDYKLNGTDGTPNGHLLPGNVTGEDNGGGVDATAIHQTGGGLAHENRPPFRVKVFIEKIS
jgi:hypothetical protein